MENKKILTLFNTKQFIFFILGIAAAVLFFVMTPFEGLSVEGMKVLGLFLLAIFWWMGSVFADYVTAFWMMALMIATKATALGTVFSAFSGSVIWIVIPVLAVGAALSKTGLLKRIVLFILSKFKASFKSQSLGFIIAGNIVDALIPSATAKVAIAAPLAKTYSETMGYEPNSKPAAGLFSSMWMGFGANGPFFLTGSTMCFTMIGLLPEGYQEGFDFLTWLGVAWPWGLALLILSYVGVRIFYTPKNDVTVSAEVIHAQREALGKMKRNEKIAAFVLIICLVLWVTESWHGISSAVVALIGMCILLSTGVLDRKDFRSSIAWESVIFIGCSTGLGSVFSGAGITDWVSTTFAPYLEPVFSNVFIMIVVCVLVITVVRFAFVSQTALMTIFTVACAPFAIAAGMHPFIPGFIALVTVNVYNASYNNGTYITAMAAADGMVQYGPTSKMSWVYTLACIVGCICCVPMWKAFGLM